MPTPFVAASLSLPGVLKIRCCSLSCSLLFVEGMKKRVLKSSWDAIFLYLLCVLKLIERLFTVHQHSRTTTSGYVFGSLGVIVLPEQCLRQTLSSQLRCHLHSCQKLLSEPPSPGCPRLASPRFRQPLNAPFKLVCVRAHLHTKRA